MRQDDRLDIPVFDIINTEYHADEKSKYKFAQAAVLVVQRCK